LSTLLAVILAACDTESGAEPDGSPTGGGKADDLESRAARFPIVLVHAFHATASNSWSLERVEEALLEDGHFVVLADLPPYASTPERARVLLDQLDTARADL